MHSSFARALTRRSLQVLSLPVFGLLLLVPRSARADVSSWMFIGGGATQFAQDGLSARTAGTMRLHLGLGSDPSHPLVVGGLFSLEPHFGYGSDLALSLRTASSSYANGNFGLALDLGGYERFWREGSAGGTGTLWLGAPWGLALGLGGSVGSHDAHEVSATIGIDFARLTIYRSSGTNWFMNPFPARRPKD